MKLFDFSLPKKGICEEKFLYYREMNDHSVVHNLHDNFLVFSNGARVRFDTYFNVFSYSKYLNFTTVSAVEVILKLQGNFIVRLYKRNASKEMCESLYKSCDKERVVVKDYEKEEEDTPALLIEKEFNSDTPQDISLIYGFSNEESEGNLFVELTSLSDDSIFYSGRYQNCTIKEPICGERLSERNESKTEVDDLQNELNEHKLIKIGIIICTYKRETYVKKALETIQDFLDSKKELGEQVGVFVIDNGKTLEAEDLFGAKVIPNKNLGGSGGFTRGMIEVASSQEGYTHFLLMDDDIVFDPSIIEKMLSILKYAKNPEKLCIGGTMLRLDIPYYQYEMGAHWTDFTFKALKQGFDLRNYVDVLANECEEEMDYNAWWCMCMPVGTVKRNGLPLPLFIKGDDAEYGIRAAKQIMVINGIGVWHEDFKSKYSSELEYYFHRNQLLINAIYGVKNIKSSFERFVRAVGKQLVFQRYPVIKNIVMAYDDFFKGYGNLNSLDGEKKHAELRASAVKQQSKVELEVNGYPVTRVYKPVEKSTWKRMMSFYGYFIPTMFYAKEDRKGYRTIDLMYCTTDDFYKAKEVLQYNFSTNTGFVTKLKRWEFVKASFTIIRMFFKFMLKYKKVAKGYRENLSVLTSLESWKKRLELE
ncbi:MAG: glycosyltransferase [Fastidiosipilaceae bacterium]|jgi:galactofuranosylgalactofuranosylrhamnosyl-N-acetylglucosaminyl-diphospho-decaprenol beta-1,5/1,6-galactofuranosyltransferase